MPEAVKSLCWCGGSLHPSPHPSYGCCERCGTFVLKSSPSEDQLKAYYTAEGYWDRHVQSLGYPTIEQRASLDLHDRIPIWHALLTAVSPHPSSILEIGCAHGGFLAYCRDRGVPVVVGVEVDPATCEYAKKRFGLDHVCSGLFPDVALPMDTFEAIVGFDVIEHFSDPVRSLKGVAERLSETGWFLFQTPCYRGEGSAWEQFKPDEHLYLYDENSVRQVCAEAGLEVVRTQPGCFRDDMFVIGRKRPREAGILWIRTGSIGDAVRSMSMLSRVKASFPDSKIVVVCQEPAAPLYEAHPSVSEVIAFNRTRALQDSGYRERLLARIAAVRASQCLHADYWRDSLGDLLSQASLAGTRVAFARDGSMGDERCRGQEHSYTRLLPSGGSDRTELDRNRAFLAALGMACEGLSPEVWTRNEDEEIAESLFEREGLPREGTLALFAGSQSSIRNYDRFAEALAPVVLAHGLRILAIGSPDQYRLHQSILDQIPGDHLNLCGGLTLLQCAAVLRRCRLAVGVETAHAHIACAVGIPNVVVLGGGRFGRTLPYSTLTSVAALPLDCYRCRWKCPHPRPYCIADISPQVVERAVLDALREKVDKPRIYVQGSAWSASEGGPARSDPRSAVGSTLCTCLSVDISLQADPPESRPMEPVAPRTTVICAVWHKDPLRFERLRGHQACLDDQDTPVDRVYVFDGGDTPPEWLKGRVVVSRQPLSLYEAWNAALVFVRTPYVLNLNLDDRLNADAVAILERRLDAGADLVGGDWKICFSQQETDASDRSTPASSLPFRPEWPPSPGQLVRLGSGTGERGTFGPACAWRMSLHEEFPRYPWRFKDHSPIRIIGDSIWWRLLLQRGKVVERVPLVIGRYYSHPSDQAEFRTPAEGEERKLAEQGITFF